MLTAENITNITDFMVNIHRALTGSSISGHGVGLKCENPNESWGAAKVASDFQEYLLYAHDYSLLETLGPPAKGLVVQTSGNKLSKLLLYGVYAALETTCLKAGYKKGIQEALAYFNTGDGGPYNALISEDFKYLANVLFPGTKYVANWIFAPELMLASMTASSDFTVHDSIDANSYAGAAISTAIVSNSKLSNDGTCKLIVSGLSRIAGGDIVPNRKFIVDICSDASVTNRKNGKFTTPTIVSDGEYKLEPTVEGDLLLEVTDIRLPSRMSQGTVDIYGKPPKGRS